MESKKCQHLQWAQPGRQICTHTALQPIRWRMPPLPRSNALSQITSRPTTDVTDAVSRRTDFCLKCLTHQHTTVLLGRGYQAEVSPPKLPLFPLRCSQKRKGPCFAGAGKVEPFRI